LKNGVQSCSSSSETLDSGFRRNDEKDGFRTFYEPISVGVEEKRIPLQRSRSGALLFCFIIFNEKNPGKKREKILFSVWILFI